MRRALAADRLGLLVAQAPDDPVGDGVELALRPARADDEVVGQRRQRGQVQQHDVGGLLVLGELDDAAGELERVALLPARRRACRALGRPSGRGVSVVWTGGVASVTVGVLLGSV